MPITKKQKEQGAWIAGTVVVVIIIVLIVVSVRHQSPPVENPGSASNQASSTVQAVASTSPEAANAPKPSTKYTQLVAEYVNRRIQFDPTCRAIPNNLTYKNPVTLMLDNRSPKPAKVSIGSRKYNLAAWGYYITTINDSPLPQTEWVGCGILDNVGQILMEK
ncbi:MAG: hypothetical protein P4L74_07000 [Candidatus Doudnabacteria bacterium]|nr:hypothetical protein [Candidatus Doudnabacteria bacterium]